MINIGKPATKFLAQEISTDEKVEKSVLSPTQTSNYSFSEKKSHLAFCALLNTQEIDVEALVNVFKSSTLQGKERILYLLKHASSEPTPPLREVLYGDDMDLAIAVAGVVGRAGEKSINAIPGLNYLVLNGQLNAKKAALAALGNIPGLGHLRLRDIIDHGNLESRKLALEAYPYHADSAAAILTGMLNDPDKQIRVAALKRFIGKNRTTDELTGLSLIPDSLFWATLPTKTKQELVLQLKDKDPEARKAAVSAVGSVGLCDTTFGYTIPDSLLKMIFDADRAVCSESIAQLNYLGQSGITPKSIQAVPLMINYLSEANNHGDVLKLARVLKQMKLSSPSDISLIERMINLSFKWGSCHNEIATLLKSNPEWAGEAVKLLVHRYPDFSRINEIAFSMLQIFGYSEIKSFDNLERMLKNPKISIRLIAAIELSEKGLFSNEITRTLEEGVRAFHLYPELHSKAANILANYYPGGVDRLIAIIKDSKTNIEIREELLGKYIRDMAGRNTQAAALLLHFAAEFPYPDLQITAIKSLPLLYLPAPQLEAVLLKAFSSPDDDVRKVVADVWEQSNLPSGSIIHRVMNDISPNVRAAGIKLIERLPKGDLGKITLLNKAILDRDWRVVNEALYFTESMGEEGQIIFENYIKAGKTPNNNFFKAIRRLFPLRQSLVKALESRISRVSPSIRAGIYEILLENDANYFVDEKVLYRLLHHPDRNERYYAAQTLLNIPGHSREVDPLVVTVLMEYYMHINAKNYLNNLYHSGLRARSPGDYQPTVFSEGTPPSYNAQASGTTSPTNYSPKAANVTLIPSYDSEFLALSNETTPPAWDVSFPWPPPPGCEQYIVDHSYFPPGSTSTLPGIHGAITKALFKCSTGFRHGSFTLSDGFALVARMERIEADGTPFPGESRWATKGVPNLKLFDFLGDLFLQKPGYFRIIVFAVTYDQSPPAKPTPMRASAALPQAKDGLPDIPDEFADTGRTNQKVIALVYTYQRKPRAEVVPWESTPSAFQHLEKSGILYHLKK